MGYIDADKLIAEIERQQRRLIVLSNTEQVDKRRDCDLENGVYNSILAIITSLQHEQPVDGLEDEMDRYFETMQVLEYENIFEDTFHRIARHFAEWGADHLRDITKMVPEGLEETPKEIYILQSKLAPNSLGACWHNHALPSNTCNNIKYIRADIDKQPVEGLDEEVERFCENMWNSLPNFNYSDGKAVITVVEKAARHFAEWGAEHLKR